MGPRQCSKTRLLARTTMFPVTYVTCEATKFDEGKEAVAHTLITEIFPIKTEEIPQLHGYKLDVTGGDLSTIGGKLSYRLKRRFPGHWAWADKRIITDTPVEIGRASCRERA